MKENLFFMDQNGKVMDYPIFTPLLQLLLPAFIADAEEIRIGYSWAEPEGIRGTYTKNGKSFPMAIEPSFHWGDVFARVKILANLSIMPVAQQSGEIRMQFNGRVVPLSIETVENEREHTLSLRPTIRHEQP